MSSVVPELSSLATQLRDITQRATAAADALNGEQTADAASALFEAERALRSALRAVERATRLLE